MAATDSILFVYFDVGSFVGFRLDRDLPFGNNLCPIRADIEKGVSDYYQSSPPGSNNVIDHVSH